MPRPRKCRRVCELPRHTEFGPRSAEGEAIPMTVDEYESIRLIALQMEVGRSTVQSIYNSARRKLALCLVAGRTLMITGGDYEVCPRRSPACARCCPRRRGEK